MGLHHSLTESSPPYQVETNCISILKAYKHTHMYLFLGFLTDPIDLPFHLGIDVIFSFSLQLVICLLNIEVMELVFNFKFLLCLIIVLIPYTVFFSIFLLEYN